MFAARFGHRPGCGGPGRGAGCRLAWRLRPLGLLTPARHAAHVLLALRPAVSRTFGPALNAALATAANVWCIFDNTAQGAAAANAIELCELLRVRNSPAVRLGPGLRHIVNGPFVHPSICTPASIDAPRPCLSCRTSRSMSKLEQRIVGQPLERIRIHSPFVLRTFDPPLDAAAGKIVRRVERLGKRIAIGLDDAAVDRAAFDDCRSPALEDARARWPARTSWRRWIFRTAQLLLTEAGPAPRAALHLVCGDDALREHDPGGLEVLSATAEQFAAVLTATQPHAEARLSDPTLFSGIGNAYSDEILHRARLSPIALTQKLSAAEVQRLFAATARCLSSGPTACEPQRREIFRSASRLSGSNGGSWAVRQARALYLRRTGPTNSLRGQGNQLLPRLPDEGAYFGRPVVSRLLKDDWPRHLDEL